MTTLIKVTFTGTTGEETTGKAQYDHASGLVTLPTSFLTLIEQAKAVGIGYALVAQEDGYQFPLLHDGGATYRMDRSRRARRSLLVLAWKAATEPTKEQRQQSGRFAHTLSAAAVIGAAGYLGTAPCLPSASRGQWPRGRLQPCIRISFGLMPAIPDGIR